MWKMVLCVPWGDPFGTTTKRSARRHHIPQRTVVRASHDQLFRSTYSMFTLCNCRWIKGVEKRSQNDYCGGMLRLQHFSAECCWWTKHASHGMGFSILVTSTHGLMKNPTFLSRCTIPAAICNNCLCGNNWRSPRSLRAIASTVRGLVFRFYLNNHSNCWAT
jgi:hypothetical protein